MYDWVQRLWNSPQWGWSWGNRYDVCEMPGKPTTESICGLNRSALSHWGVCSNCSFNVIFLRVWLTMRSNCILTQDSGFSFSNGFATRLFWRVLIMALVWILLRHWLLWPPPSTAVWWHHSHRKIKVLLLLLLLMNTVFPFRHDNIFTTFDCWAPKTI